MAGQPSGHIAPRISCLVFIGRNILLINVKGDIVIKLYTDADIYLTELTEVNGFSCMA